MGGVRAWWRRRQVARARRGIPLCDACAGGQHEYCREIHHHGAGWAVVDPCGCTDVTHVVNAGITASMIYESRSDLSASDLYQLVEDQRAGLFEPGSGTAVSPREYERRRGA